MKETKVGVTLLETLATWYLVNKLVECRREEHLLWRGSGMRGQESYCSGGDSECERPRVRSRRCASQTHAEGFQVLCKVLLCADEKYVVENEGTSKDPHNLKRSSNCAQHDNRQYANAKMNKKCKARSKKKKKANKSDES